MGGAGNRGLPSLSSGAEESRLCLAPSRRQPGGADGSGAVDSQTESQALRIQAPLPPTSLPGAKREHL